MSGAARDAVLEELCRELKVPAVLRSYPALARQARDAGIAYEDFLRELLEEEVR